ncbi:innexin unc-7-like [Mytilus edulis]|uniref:innexin unc-7-like n=1 Tax=Mytilus edulis TaxID=6550 RepID=UPI0039F0F181
MISKYFKPVINYSSWADRFSSIWTFLAFIIIALVAAWRHHVGPNVSCYLPYGLRYQPNFTSEMSKYIHDRCWSARQLTVYYPEHRYEYAVVSDEYYNRRKDSRRTLYQWLPVIIACQALFFRLPDVLLRVFDSLFGYGSSKIVGLVRGYKSLSAIDRTALARELANYFNVIFASRTLKKIGILAVVIIFVKILFFANALTQLILLDGYLSPTNESSYGQHIVDGIISRNYSEIDPSPSFPREVYCYVNLHRFIPNLNHTLQCSVPVNEFNEQICFFMWVWLLVVCVAAALSLVVFIIKGFVPIFRERFILKYLKMASLAPSKTQTATFTNSVIGQDGILLLKLIREVSSDILVRDIVVKIWYLHYIEPRSKDQSVQYPDKSTGYKV